MSPKYRGRWRKSGEGLFVKEGQNRGRGKGKEMIYGKKKRFKSKVRKITKCYGCKQIGHWNKDCPNKSGNSTSTNVV